MPYKNKAEQKKAQHESYLRHKDKIFQRTKKRRRQRIAWLRILKSALKCSKCPERHPACLEFHHKNASDKFMSVASMVGFGYSEERVRAEIKKCIVLCSNCHQKLHWQKRISTKTRAYGKAPAWAQDST